jgi:hypothetical protein
MSEVGWDDTKLHEGACGIRVRASERASTIKNEFFIGETQRGA